MGDKWRGYLAFVISFYVAANYWGVHRRAMRAVTTIDTRLVSHTLPVLLLVAELPFPASVLATHGDLPSALAFYSAFNVVGTLALIRLLTDIGLHARWTRPGIQERERLWANIIVLLLCIPGAFVLQGNGPWLLLLLMVAGRVPRIRRDTPRGQVVIVRRRSPGRRRPARAGPTATSRARCSSLRLAATRLIAKQVRRRHRITVIRATEHCATTRVLLVGEGFNVDNGPRHPRSPVSLLSSIAHRLTERARAVAGWRRARGPRTADVGRLFELTFDLMGVASLDGTMLRVNPGIERVLGLAPEEVVGRRLFDIVHPDDREGTAAAFAGVLEAGQLCRVREPALRCGRLVQVASVEPARRRPTRGSSTESHATSPSTVMRSES